MEPTQPSGRTRIGVLVSAGASAVETIEFAVAEVQDTIAELDRPVSVTVVRPDTGPPVNRLRYLLRSRLGTGAHELDIESVPSVDELQLESLRSLLPPGTVDRLVVDPALSVPLGVLRSTYGQMVVEVAPASVDRPRRELLHRGGFRRAAVLFASTYVFYLAIGGFSGGADLLTGGISATAVALSLARVALREEPTLRRTGGRLLRLAVFVPWLLWEIAKANLNIAYVILHPALPIDPSISTYETPTREPVERMVLANAITLTPGTVALDVRGGSFTIHSLTDRTRADLLEGRLARVVAWVFHGRGDREDVGGSP